MNKKATGILFLGLALIFSVSHALSAQDNYRAKATRVSVAEPMQVPGTVLQPGDYIFRLNDSDANRHIVEIWDRNETKRITQVLAIPNARLHPTPKGIMTYEERPSGQPVALEAWFYSGETTGQQFLYPKSKAAELSKLNNTQVPSTGSEEAFPGEKSDNQQVTENRTSDAAQPAPIPAETRPTEPVYSASAQTPTAPQDRTAPAAREPNTNANANAASDTANRLPNTASPLPLIGMLGTSLVGIAVLLKVLART